MPQMPTCLCSCMKFVECRLQHHALAVGKTGGGGVYIYEEFTDACDEYGVMVGVDAISLQIPHSYGPPCIGL